MFQIKIANVNIDIHDGPIGVSCSGGADSSLLLYILMKHALGPIHVFTCVLDSKNKSTLKSSTAVISKIIDCTGNYNVYHHFHFVKESKKITELFFQQINFLENKTINLLYTAITKNPPLDVQETFDIPSTENHERHPLLHRSVYAHKKTVYTPFTNIDKQTISEMYKELNLMQTLFPTTRSCESYTLEEGHCGDCWWCKERLWGFGQL